MNAVIDLPAEVTSPALARRFVEQSFAGSEVAELAEVVVLLVSELVTNAVLHAHSASVLRLVHQDGRLRVELQDTSTDEALKAAASSNGHRPGGRGILLVDSLADRWGSDLHDHGKTVWFELVASG